MVKFEVCPWCQSLVIAGTGCTSPAEAEECPKNGTDYNGHSTPDGFPSITAADEHG